MDTASHRIACVYLWQGGCTGCLGRRVENNRLTGSVPPLNLTALITFLASNNSLSGTIPFLPRQASSTLPRKQLTLYLSRSLQTLALHKNSFSGPATGFDNLKDLETLSVFSNELTGHLSLPNTSKISRLYTQSNHLSCIIRFAPKTTTTIQTLVAPGEALEYGSVVVQTDDDYYGR